MKFGIYTREWDHTSPTNGDIVNSTAEITLQAGPAANVAGANPMRLYLGSLQVEHDVLGGVTELIVEDGSGGTVKVRRKLQTPANESGITMVFEPPIKFTPGNGIFAKALTAVTGGIYITATGYIGA